MKSDILALMDLVAVMRTAGNCRDLRPDPVPQEIIYRVLDNARFAPSGRNWQGWRVIVVRDPETRRALRDLYASVWYGQMAPLRTPPGEETEPEPYADHLDQVPVHLVILADQAAITTTIEAIDSHQICGGSSVYPFVQNMLLGLRAEGLGAAFTALHVAVQDAVRQLLRVPESFLVAGHIGVGWPVKPLPTRLSRKPVEEFATEDRFDGPSITA
jgi:nitroreductase